MINGDTGIGLTILLLWLLALLLDISVIGLVVGVPLGLAMFIWGLIDAYQGAGVGTRGTASSASR